MITMADEIVRAPESWLRGGFYKQIAEALRRPAANHVGQASRYAPAVDRFIFKSSDVDLICGAGDSFEPDFDLWSIARPPLPECWIEFGNWGWFISKVDVAPGLSRNHAVSFTRGKKSVPPVPVGHIYMPDEGTGDRLAAGGVFEHWPAEGVEDAMGDMCFLALLLVLLASPNVASTRRVAPGLARRPSAEYARRQAQRGRPVYSFNEVSLTAGRTAVHNGVLRPVESFAGMRGHMVIGHWRLVDRKLAPEWVWIEGHKRGDAALGFITKQRIVQGMTDRLRRGFLVPREPGQQGERHVAVSA